MQGYYTAAMTEIVNTTALFFGLLGHRFFFPSLMVFGLFTKKRNDILRLVPLVAISLFLNFALKQYFQKPLPDWMNTTNFAFPSGHMQSALVFLGWVYLHAKQWPRTRLLIPVILVGIGWQMIHRGFHDIVDVLGGALVGGVILTTYYYTRTRTSVKTYVSRVYVVAVLFCLSVYTNIPGVPTDLLGVLGITSVLGMGWYFRYNRGMCKCTNGKSHGRKNTHEVSSGESCR